MKILFLGDVYGSPGREAIQKILPELKRAEGIHLTIANIENAAHGKGITVPIVEELLSCGVNFFTSGNHIWDVKEIIPKLKDKSFPLIRPANYPEGNPGRGHDVIQTTLLKNVLVINLQGRVFMPEGLDNPFRKADEILALYQNDPTISAILVDFHAEATSEKHALRHYLDGRVTALVGTHTHVQTNDAIVSKSGTAYISDLGMTGVVWDSVIGLEKKAALSLFLQGNLSKWEVARGEALVQGVIIETDDATKQAVSIKTVQQKVPG